MKRIVKIGIATLSIIAMLTGCGQAADSSGIDYVQTNIPYDVDWENAVNILLADTGITVDGEAVSTEETAAVYTANDIVYYEAGKDFTYGEGTEADEHTAEEATAHTVVHITKPGTYVVNGKLSAGQIAIDLGEDAEENPEAVVNLVLNGVDIKCSVAPGVIFYNVYECGSTEEEDATNTVDTSKAGANVIIADGTENHVDGSYVARIYKSVELNEEGTEVIDSKKLHKYDGAFYSKMSMNIYGEEKGDGILNITAENEGLDSELHLTVNGGVVNITSGNDGINTNEDGISVTTINGGTVNITVDGSTGEGDGIDSNGWLVINGGIVMASACDKSADAGIDSDMGIHINGGTVIATGNMLDRISDSTQNYAVFSFAAKQNGGTTYSLKNEKKKVIAEATPENGFTYLIFSVGNMEEGTYTLWMDDTKLAGASVGGMMAGGFGGGFGMGGEMMERPEGMEPPEGMEMPEGMEPPEGMEMPEGMEPPEGMEMPEGMEPPEGMEKPEGMEPPEGMEIPEGMERPEGGRGDRGNMGNMELTTEFSIVAGGNYFSNVSTAQ